MGCFWGVERRFWEIEGVYTTAVGYAGGTTPNPDYKLVCSGSTGHAEVVLVVFDPAVVSYEELLKTFWENHDPTQGMRQGNDIGTQYRSGIYTLNDEQAAAASGNRTIIQTQRRVTRPSRVRSRGRPRRRPTISESTRAARNRGRRTV